MSHKLYRRANGEYAFASTQPEWHRLREPVPNPMTAAEALQATGMDQMELVEADADATIITDGQRLTLPMNGYKAIVLHDKQAGEYKAIGPVGANRLITQFPDVVEPLDVLIDTSGGIIETFGLLEPGGEWFASVRLPEDVTIGGDQHYPYVWATDGLWSAYRCAPVMQRVCCGNTNAAALMEIRQREMAWVYSMMHRPGAKVDVEAIRRMIGLTYEMAHELDEISRIMLDQEYVDTQFHKLTDQLFGTPAIDRTTMRVIPASLTKYKARTRKLSSLFNGDSSSLETTWRNGTPTKWTAFQAISEYVDWMAPVRGNVTARRLERTMDSSVQGIKTRALEALL